MNGELTHASFFSGVGGTDLGLERAGWRTVSFSEIDPYACAVLAERWPGVPNVGDIVELQDGEHRGARRLLFDGGTSVYAGRPGGASRDDWQRATLWSGGFPCQDLSVAGKRRGMVDGTRSNLAYAFLALVERHRPPAILLENVPGLLSSHGGRDMAALCGRMVELGYGVAYRVLDAQYFGVPQRRRRVFIVGLRSDPDDADGRLAAERATAVLSVGARCERHPATGHQTGAGVAERTTVGALPAGVHGFPDGVQEFMQGHFRVVSPPPDANGMRAPDGLAGRPHDRGEVVNALDQRHGGADDNEAQAGHLIMSGSSSDASGAPGELGGRGSADRLPHRYVCPACGTDVPNSWINHCGPFTTPLRVRVADDPLPLGLDSHRYRCCGNGVVAPVAEWIGAALHHYMSRPGPARAA